MPTQAQIDEIKKIRLEKIVIPEIKSLFNRMNKENAQSIAATGMPVVVSKFQGEWESLLRKHYVRVQGDFMGDIEALLNEEDQGLSELEMAALLAALILWRDQRARNSSRIITNTNERQISESVQSSRQLFTEQNERAPSNRELALGAAVIFRRKYKPRSENIAMIETETPAENTKFTEAAVLSGEKPADVIRPGSMVATKSLKIWRDFGDNRVRAIHKRLNGVKKLLNTAFETGGERLMYPKDTSLGATAKNVMGCRCSLDFDIKRVRRGERVDGVMPKPITPELQITTTGKLKPIKPDANLSSKPKTKPTFKPPQKQPSKGLEVRKADIPDTEDIIKKTGKLTASEKQNVSWYSGDGFRELNDYLRNPKAYSSSISHMESLNKFSKSLNSAISKRVTTQNMKLYRGVDSDKFTNFLKNKDLIGKKLPINAFQSTSKSRSLLQAYSGFGGVEMRISIKKGTNLIDLVSEGVARNIAEAEVLLPNKGVYVIKKISKETGKIRLRTILEVDYVQ